ncbi:MAG: creatininase family protein [Gemmatimonadota bacterium]
MPRPLRLKELTPGEAAAALARAGRLIVPVGTLEVRGPHLPLGCDTVIVEHLADQASARTGVPCAPVIEYGVHASADLTTPGLASLSRKTLHRVMNELIAAWEIDAKVKEFMILTAHAADAHQEALSTIRALGEIRFFDVLDLDPEATQATVGMSAPPPSLLETALMLHLAPEQVRLELVPPSLGATAEQGARLAERILDMLGRYLGCDPAASLSTAPGVAGV